eukprot:151418_1
MGNQNHTDTKSTTQNTYSKSSVHKPKGLHQLTKECSRIASVCDKHKDMKLLRMKLAILEIKTFKKVTYPQHCGYLKCKAKAPPNFPESDVFICTQHLKELKSHLFELNESMEDHEKIIGEYCKKKGTKETKEDEHEEIIIFKKVMEAVRGVDSSIKGSINNQCDLPKDYWSLLMAKLLIVLKHCKLVNKDQVTIQLVEGLIESMYLYRYVMNPIGVEILRVIYTLTTGIIEIVNAGAVLVAALNDVLAKFCAGILEVYGMPLMNGLVDLFNVDEGMIDRLAKGVLEGATIGAASCAALGAIATAPVAELGGIGPLTGGVVGGAIGGIAALILEFTVNNAQNQNQQGAVQPALQAIRQHGQDIQ